MDFAKLNEALEDLRSKRDVLEQAMSHIENAISALSGGNGLHSIQNGNTSTATVRHERTSPRSYIDDAVTLITEAGHPLHARDLAEGMSKVRNRDVPRSSMESRAHSTYS